MINRNLSAINDALVTSGSDDRRSFLGVQLVGTFTATVVVEGTNDNGTWVTVAATPWGGGAAVTSMTAPGGWRVDVSGMQLVRIRVSSYTSGTVGVWVLPVVNA